MSQRGCLATIILLCGIFAQLGAASQKCLGTQVSANAETQESINGMLAELTEAGWLTRGWFVNWTDTEEGARKAAFLPRGSRLQGSLAEAQRKVEGLEGVLSFAVPQRAGIDIPGSGSNEPIRIWNLDWSSAQVMQHVFRILAEETILFNVELSEGSSHSLTGLLEISGCNVPETFSDSSSSSIVWDCPRVHAPSAHALLEAWPSAQRSWDIIPEEYRPDSAGYLQYQGFEGVFVTEALLGTTLQEPSQCTPPLDFYRSLTSDVFPSTGDLFDTLQTIIDSVTSANMVPCSEWTSLHQEELQKYLEHTRDQGGVDSTQGAALAPKCSFDDRVWLSKACRQSSADCIPFLTHAGYYIHEAMQQSFFWDWPVAIINLNSASWQRAGVDFKVLMQWWTPDKTFVGMKSIMMPQANARERDNGLYRTGQDGMLMKYVWRGLSSASTQAHTFVSEFNLEAEDLSQMMISLHAGSNASETACAWVREHPERWLPWTPQPCPSGFRFVSKATGGTCEACKPGTMENRSICVSCLPGKYSPSEQATQCYDCPTGRYSDEDFAVCASYVEDESTFLILVLTSSCVALLLFIIVGFVIWRRMEARFRAEPDAPDKVTTTTGEFVFRWAGPTIHERLTRVIAQRKRTTISNAKDISKKIREMREMNEPEGWLVNASPFDIRLGSSFDWDSWVEAESFQPIPAWSRGKKHFHVEVRNSALQDTWSELNASDLPATFVVHADDWKREPAHPSDRVSSWDKNSIQYEREIARFALPHTDTFCMGDLKLVSGPLHCLLILWSPPHEYRGVPVLEFEAFLNNVISDKAVWKCTDYDESGQAIFVNKKPGSYKRNMYDANQHLLLNTVTILDASYAENMCNYGPANLFISHVWQEGAFNTLRAVTKLMETFIDHCKSPAERKKLVKSSSMASSDTLEVFKDFRVWFCTLCNNQSRIKEELGNAVEFSPFARVLRLSTCTSVALVSPFLALERKWCNYEFCVAKNAGKTVLMATAEGVVQAGSVAPKTLVQLADKVISFDCANSSCSSPEDEALINEAVIRMGGYKALNQELRAVFHQAILEAHSWATVALERIEGKGQDEPRKTWSGFSNGSEPMAPSGFAGDAVPSDGLCRIDSYPLLDDAVPEDCDRAPLPKVCGAVGLREPSLEAKWSGKELAAGSPPRLKPTGRPDGIASKPFDLISAKCVLPDQLSL